MANSSDDEGIKRKPFQKIKTLLKKLTTRSRSASPATLASNNIVFTSGIIHHAHSNPESDSTPSKYLLLAVSHEGQLLDIPTQTTSNIGYITCQCKPHQQTSGHRKNIAFITSAHPPRLSRREHYVDSPFVFPQLTSAQKSTSKAYPLFFKLPPAYADNTSLVQEHSLELHSIILARLQELTEHVEQEDVDHVYARLFDTKHELDLDQGTQSSEDSSSSNESHHQSETSSSLSTRLNRTASPGVLIYAHHNQVLKTFTRTELHEVFKTLSYSKQDKVKRKLEDANHPIAGIYLDNSTRPDTTEVFTIRDMRDMQTLHHKPRLYNRITKKSLNYTLALLTDIHTHVPSVSQLTKISNSKSFMDQLKSLITSSSPPTYQCSKCTRTYETTADLQRHTTAKHPKKHKHKNKQRHSLPTHHRSHSSASSSSSSSSASRSVERNDPTTYPTILNKQTYQPPILDSSSCPSTYTIFWNLKAKTRKLPPENKRIEKFVAPHFPRTMLKLAEQVNFPDLLNKEFEAHAHAYDSLVKENNFASISTAPTYTVGVINSEHDLSVTGQTRILENLKKNAPALEVKTLSKLSESKLIEFFFLARTYMLTSSIPWDSFSDYFITQATLGPEIYAKVTNALIGYPTYKKLLKNFSTFIERIILKLLPVQESYYDAEVRILEKHKQHLLGPNPSIDYTKTYIHSDAQDLSTKSPFYIQLQNTITDEQHRMMIENEKTNLLHKIITHTTFDAKIHKLLIASTKYKNITEVPNNELLDNLQNLIQAEEKSAIALVNATKLSLSSTPTPTHNTRSRAHTSSSPKLRNRSGSGSRNSQPNHTHQSRQPSLSPNRRRHSSRPQLQSKCDTCLKLSMPEDFCHSNKHCRRDGHQPDYRKSSELERKVRQNDPDTFISFENCPKCFPCKHKPTQWLHGNTSSQVMVPPNYFSSPPPSHVHYVNTDPSNAPWQTAAPWPQRYQEYVPTPSPHNFPPSHRPTNNWDSPNQDHSSHRSPYYKQDQPPPPENYDRQQNFKR